MSQEKGENLELDESTSSPKQDAPTPEKTGTDATDKPKTATPNSGDK